MLVTHLNPIYTEQGCIKRVEIGRDVCIHGLLTDVSLGSMQGRRVQNLAQLERK